MSAPETEPGKQFKHLMPPRSVLDGAKCHPGNADLFQQPKRGEKMGPGRQVRLRREATALLFCNGWGGRPSCPVRTQCLIWALENRMLGVYGGEVLSTKTYRKDRGGDADELLALLRGVDEDPGDQGLEPGGEPGHTGASSDLEADQPLSA